MSAYYDKCFSRVIGHEGGYVNDPRDPGGETKFGVSKRSYPKLNIKNLTLADAKAIYAKDYWCRSSCDLLPAGVAFLVFDASVNHGVKQSIKFLQRAVGAVDDGVIGPQTLKAVARAKPEAVIRSFCDQRLAFYKSLSTFKIYGKGWSRRLVETRAQALADIR